MTRTEATAVAIVAGLLVLLAATIATGAASSLNRLDWFGGGANEIQWSSAAATAATFAAAFLYLNRTCAASHFCFRLGEHPVDGTLKKVCDHHHTSAHHRQVLSERGAAHRASGRLARGESHGRS